MKKIRWGVLGCGGISDRRTIPGLILADNAELIAVMDVNADEADRVKSKYGAKYAFSSAEELIKVSDIEAVYIASPVTFHYKQALMCAEAGKHVLLEKPLGLTTSEVRSIVNVFSEKKLKLGSAFMMRFSSLHSQIKDIIDRREIGEIVSMRAQFTCWYPEIQGAWRQSLSTSGGGAMMDMGIHCIDILHYITGLKGIEVAAFMGNKLFKYEVEDSSSMLMRMENGSLAVVEASFNIPDEASYSKLEIYGSAGSIIAESTLSQEDTGKAKVIRADNNKEYNAGQNRVPGGVEELSFAAGNLYQREIEAFGKSLLDGAPVPVTAEDSLYAQTIVESAYLSNKTKAFVPVNFEVSN